VQPRREGLCERRRRGAWEVCGRAAGCELDVRDEEGEVRELCAIVFIVCVVDFCGRWLGRRGGRVRDV
jgi:hypothetical protein